MRHSCLSRILRVRPEGFYEGEAHQVLPNRKNMNWNARRVLITGGASFIGSHLTDALVARGAQIRILDDLSSGRLENIQKHLRSPLVEFIRADLLTPGVAQSVVNEMEIVFHLAANHGGRGYLEMHQAACATNLALDGMLFHACYAANVEKVIYASSGCVYPNYLQDDPQKVVYLNEDTVGPPYDADNMYGWAKLMGEMTLRAYYRDWGMKSASCWYSRRTARANTSTMRSSL